MGKPERLQIASLPSNQTIFMHGYFVLGSTSMSEPTPDRCMLLSKRFSRITQHRREIWWGGAFISLFISVTSLRLIVVLRHLFRISINLFEEETMRCNLSQRKPEGFLLASK